MDDGIDHDTHYINKVFSETWWGDIVHCNKLITIIIL